MTPEIFLPVFSVFIIALGAMTLSIRAIAHLLSMNNLQVSRIPKSVIRVNFAGNFVKRQARRVILWQRNRVAMRRLRAMPNWLLRDLGIERYQIPQMVKYASTKPRNIAQQAALGGKINLPYAA